MNSWLKNLVATGRDALGEHRVHKLCEELQRNVVSSLLQIQECRRYNRPVFWKLAVPDEQCSSYFPFLKRSPSFRQHLDEAFKPYLELLRTDGGVRVTVDERVKARTGFFGTGYRDYVVLKLESV